MAGREECRSISFVPNKTRSFFAIERAGTRAELSRDLNCAGITGLSAGTMARRNRSRTPVLCTLGIEAVPKIRKPSRRSPSHAKIEKFLEVLFYPRILTPIGE